MPRSRLIPGKAREMFVRSIKAIVYMMKATGMIRNQRCRGIELVNAKFLPFGTTYRRLPNPLQELYFLLSIEHAALKVEPLENQKNDAHRSISVVQDDEISVDCFTHFRRFTHELLNYLGRCVEQYACFGRVHQEAHAHIAVALHRLEVIRVDTCLLYTSGLSPREIAHAENRNDMALNTKAHL